MRGFHCFKRFLYSRAEAIISTSRLLGGIAQTVARITIGIAGVETMRFVTVIEADGELDLAVHFVRRIGRDAWVASDRSFTFVGGDACAFGVDRSGFVVVAKANFDGAVGVIFSTKAFVCVKGTTIVAVGTIARGRTFGAAAVSAPTRVRGDAVDLHVVDDAAFAGFDACSPTFVACSVFVAGFVGDGLATSCFVVVGAVGFLGGFVTDSGGGTSSGAFADVGGGVALFAATVLIRHAFHTFSSGAANFAGLACALWVCCTLTRRRDALFGTCSGVASRVGGLACAICIALALVELLSGLQTEAITALFATRTLRIIRAFDHTGFFEGMTSVGRAFFCTSGRIADAAAQGVIAFVSGIAVFEACVFAVFEAHTCRCIADFICFALRVGSASACPTVATVGVGVFGVGSARTSGQSRCKHHRKSSSTQKAYPSLNHHVPP